MANSFLYDDAGVSLSCGDLKEALDGYRTNVGILERYISEMNGSSAWKDENVKASFVAAAQGYVSAYKAFISGIEVYIDCLTKKADNFLEHENNYMK